MDANDTDLWAAAPPRERGWTARSMRALPRGRGSPARAGMDLDSRAMLVVADRLPRASGDGPLSMALGCVDRGAPPRERGWTVMTKKINHDEIGSPARAGMDPARRSEPKACARLPRASGDGPHTVATYGEAMEAPPRERGWTVTVALDTLRRYGSPARAGMDLERSRFMSATCWLPRASGDGPTSSERGFGGASAPPRERGWTFAKRWRSDLVPGKRIPC